MGIFLLLSDANEQAMSANTDIKSSQLRLKHMSKEVKEKDQSLKYVGKEYAKMKNDSERLQAEIAEIRVS